jgi:hypothetical protein
MSRLAKERMELTPAQRAAILAGELDGMRIFTRRYVCRLGCGQPVVLAPSSVAEVGLDGSVLDFTPQAKAAIKRWILSADDRFDRE